MPAAVAKKQVNESSFNRMIVAGCAMALLGAWLGFLCLLGQIPAVFTDEAQFAVYSEEHLDSVGVPFEAHFFKGAVASSKDWEQKRVQLFSPTTQRVELSDADLNAWFNADFRPAFNTASQQPFQFYPRQPNIYISERVVYLSIPIDVSIWGSKKKWVLFASGSFVGEGNPQFKVDSLYLNNAPFPFAGAYGSSVLNALVNVFRGAEDYQSLVEAWGRIESIEIESNRMQIQLR